MLKLIFGCGYLGQYVARRWQDAGHSVTIVTRRLEHAAIFEQQGYRAIVADVTQPETLCKLPAATTVLFAVGHDRASGHSIQQVYAEGMRNVLAALPQETGRLIYISTTGVYGSANGGWVDETTPPAPQREGGRASLAAEQVLAAHPLGPRSIVLRLAGIYGPGRIPFVRDLQAGNPLAAPQTGYLNLIHVEDAAAVVVAADQLTPFHDGPRVYCVSDGNPVVRGDFYREVARRMRAATPQFVNVVPDSPRAARAAANRRVNNQRMRMELGVKLTYPDYRAGLKAAMTGSVAFVETQNQ
jgi:nucleoside-diphosphate-sugar epimerase